MNNKTVFTQSPDGDITATFGETLLGVWFLKKRLGTFQTAAGPTGKIADLTSWITLMNSWR